MTHASTAAVRANTEATEGKAMRLNDETVQTKHIGEIPDVAEAADNDNPMGMDETSVTSTDCSACTDTDKVMDAARRRPCPITLLATLMQCQHNFLH